MQSFLSTPDNGILVYNICMKNSKLNFLFASIFLIIGAIINFLPFPILWTQVGKTQSGGPVYEPSNFGLPVLLFGVLCILLAAILAIIGVVYWIKKKTK